MPAAVERKSTSPTGVLLVGHGTRSALGQSQCQALAAEVAGRLERRLFATELAYLEMASPTIEEAILLLAEQNIERLVVVPLLLFAAGHAREDVPTAVLSALDKAGLSGLPTVQMEPLGLQEPMVELAAARFHAAADPRIPAAETMLLLIGRGSRDEEATSQMRKLGSLVHNRLGIGETQVGFLAMAQPTANEIIRAAACGTYRQIVVQPHLLFHGELLDRLEQQVSAAAAASPRQMWHASRVLGGQASPLSQILRQAILSAGNS